MDIQSFHSAFVVVNSVTVFLTIKYIFEYIKIKEIFEKIIISMGSCSFGIYLLHLCIKERDIFYSTLEKMQQSKLNDMLAVLIMCMAVFLIGYVLTFILSKVPIIKKIVGF